MRFLPSLMLLLPLASPFAQAELIDDVNDRGELRIAVEANTPPFSFKQDGHLTGFEVELGELLARELEVYASIIVTGSQDLLTGVASGKYDVAINHIVQTPEMRNQFDFSEPYGYASTQRLVRKEPNPPADTLQVLKDQLLGVAQGSQFVELAALEGPRVPDAQPQARGADDRSADAQGNESLLLHPLTVKQGAGLDPRVALAIPFQKGNPAFQASLDKALQRIRADGRLAALSNKWFGADNTQP